MKTLSVWLSVAILFTGCATSTEGLTKDQIADRERARAARVSFYSQLTAALIMGAANAQGFKK